MKTTALLLTLGLSFFLVGCGPSKAEREAAERERARLGLERKAEEERRIANEAFRSIGNKLGRKAPGTTFGPPPDAPAQTPDDTLPPASERRNLRSQPRSHKLLWKSTCQLCRPR